MDEKWRNHMSLMERRVENIMKAMKKGKFNTVLGTLSFDKKGDVSLPGYVWYEWSKGNYKQL